MTWQDALEFLAHHHHIENYRRLCREDNPDIEQRDGYRLRIIEKADGQPEPPAPIQPRPVVQQAPPDPWLPLIRMCDDFNPGCCASPLPYCTRFSINPSRETCIECLTGQGITPDNHSQNPQR